MIRKLLEAFLVIVLCIPLIVRSTTVAAIVVPPVLLYFVLKFWTRQVLARIVIRVQYPEERFFPGDKFELEVQIENRAWLPLHSLEVSVYFPKGISVAGPEELVHSLGQSLKLKTRINAQERLRLTVQCLAEQRGWYRVEEIIARGSDVFSWHEAYARQVVNDGYIVVYPELRQLPSWPVESRTAFGLDTAHSWVYRDPFNIVGIREYQGDSIADVDWKATARSNQLMVRQVQASFAPTAAVYLDVATTEYYWQGILRERFEAAVTVAAAILFYLEQQGSPFSLVTNGVSIDRRAGALYLPQGQGARHLGEALAILAGVAPIERFSASRTLYEISVVAGTQSIIYIAAYLGDRVRRDLLKLAANGHTVTLLWVGERGQIPLLPRVASISIEEVLPDAAQSAVADA